MKIAHSNTEFRSLPKDYAGLCRLLMPRPIRDKVDFENVTRLSDAMAGHKLSSDQQDYFDLLCRLIQDYEQAQDEMKQPQLSGLEALRHLLEVHGMTAAELARLLGVHRSLGAMILRGERQLTLGHVRVLSRHFSVSAELFL
jgi:antitoxin component HigA of HigAB toxin-antitoxin module